MQIILYRQRWDKLNLLHMLWQNQDFIVKHIPWPN